MTYRREHEARPDTSSLSEDFSSLSGGGSELSFTDCGPIRHSFSVSPEFIPAYDRGNYDLPFICMTTWKKGVTHSKSFWLFTRDASILTW